MGGLEGGNGWVGRAKGVDWKKEWVDWKGVMDGLEGGKG